MFKVGTLNEENRRAWVEKNLKQLPPGQRILDAGAGTQVFKKYCDHLKYVSQDFGEYKGDQDASGLHPEGWSYGKLDITCDITAIPEPDASFDAILCTEVIEHVPEPLLALKELSRLLKPGGTLLLTAPFTSQTHFAPYHFHTGFSRFFYRMHLPRYGLEIEELTANGSFYDQLAQEVRRSRHYARSETGVKSSFFDRVGIVLMLRFLERCSRTDKNSHEFWCFGYHVRARKRA